MKDKKVFVVVGIGVDDDPYYILSKYGVKSTFEKAQKELDEIEKEIVEEYQQNGLDIEIERKEDSLIVIYDDDVREKYDIKEIIVDYE